MRFYTSNSDRLFNKGVTQTDKLSSVQPKMDLNAREHFRLDKLSFRNVKTFHIAFRNAKSPFHLVKKGPHDLTH